MIGKLKAIQVQRLIVVVSLLLFVIKISAWWYTKSLAILTDALESIVNIVGSIIGLYSVWLAAQPRDLNHPYGHGKIEFISAAIEGTMIIVAALIIGVEGVRHFIHPRQVQQVDFGIILIAFTALLNFLLGNLAVKVGVQKHSIALQATGKHLKTDCISTIGIIVALVAIKFTGFWWLDPAIALVMAVIIAITGYKMVRRALSGIMDEANMQLLDLLVSYLHVNRKPDWIDLHNLRVIEYGSVYHVDAHLTIPWYYNIREGHAVVDDIRNRVIDKYGDRVELFIHTDGCESFSCPLCAKMDCEVRQKPFVAQEKWTLENIVRNSQHGRAEQQ